jgi:hypothetical protein
MKLADLVAFRREQLFEGAVQVSWFYTDQTRTKQAASSFVFHGPSYHGVAQQDLGAARDHHLTDTATFTRDIARSFAQDAAADNPFTLAIAGYGTGKSHLGLTLATLFGDPTGPESKRILDNIRTVDKPLAEEIRHDLQHQAKPFLVLAINGMEDFALAPKISELLLDQLRALKQDTTPIEDLKPRFKTATKFIERNFKLHRKALSDRFGTDTSEKELLARLSRADERAYEAVNKVFEEATGSPIRAAGQESLQELLAAVATAYCGKDGPFQGLLIIFDEFGRYLEYAVQHPSVAGSAALQQLFEGVQAHSHCLHLLCFIQHELKAYIARVAQDRRDEINRYIGRFDTARKVYLSTNLETIFASLIEKRNPAAIRVASDAVREDDPQFALLRKWLPGWEDHALWSDPARFAKIVKEGCWPLHPAATWFLYRLASVGKSLQQRSAVSLLEDAISLHRTAAVPDGQPWSLSAATVCSDAVVKELIGAESQGQQAPIAHAFLTVRDRHEHALTPQEDRLLRAILISSKISLRVGAQSEANQALTMLAGTSPHDTTRALQKLTGDYGVIAWNARANRYEIIGDAVPRAAFDKWLREKIGSIAPEQLGELFASYGQSWSPHLTEIKPAFAEELRIQTKEWRFEAACSCPRLLTQHLREAYTDWLQAFDVETARGRVIFCYVGPDDEIQNTQETVRTTLANLAADKGRNWKTLPIFAVLLHDKSGDLANAIAEWTVLKNTAGTPEVAQFTNFIAERESQLLDELTNEIADRITERCYVWHSNVALQPARLGAFGASLFQALYPNAICFPFDGYQTTQGNAARDCRELTIALFQGDLTHDWIQARPAQMQNRARALLLANGWDVIGPDGHVQLLPKHREAASIFRALQDSLDKNDGLALGQELRNLCLPPFGCNLASAGLLLGLFISARRDKLAFTLSGKATNPSAWISQAFGNRSLLQLDVLDQTHLRLVKKTESDAWERLLAEWEAVQTHVDKVDWGRKAATLRNSVQIPGFLFDRHQLLELHTSQAKAALERWEQRCSKLHSDHDDAYEHKNAGNLSRWGEAFHKLHTEMLLSPKAWTPEQFKLVEPMIEQCRQAVIQFFPRWLEKQDEIDFARIGDFKHRMGLVKGNLITLKLSEQALALEQRVLAVVAGVEARIQWATAANAARAFLRTNSPNPNSGVAQLNQAISNANAHIKALTDAYSHVRSQDFLDLRSEVETLKHAAEKALQTHKNRAAKIENSQLKTTDDIATWLSELRALTTIFDGCQVDLANFAVYRTWLERIDNDLSRLDDDNLTATDFAKLAKSITKEAKTAQTEDDELPWDLEETYARLIAFKQTQRETVAATWVTNNIPPKKNIASMEAREAQRLKTLLQAAPVFLSKEQTKKVEEAINACEARLDELQVDGLLAKFEALSPAGKKEFMKKAEKLMKAR